MVGAIGAASGYDSIFSIGYSRRTAATSSDFRVPESPITGKTEDVAATQQRDPIQDSVELSRNFPELLVNQTYAPPMEQQVAFAIRGAQQPSSMSESDEEEDYLNDSGLLYSELASDEQPDSEEDGSEESTTVNEAGGESQNGAEQLTEEEQQKVRELADRDREVRAHEQAHKSVGGAIAGAMSFEYQQGPDGQRYAVGGEVSIDISASDDPQKTIEKMRQVKSAAMAPAEPSSQDFKVAAQASQKEAEARTELNKTENDTEGSEETDSSETEGVEEGQGVNGVTEDSSGTSSQSGNNISAGDSGSNGVSSTSSSNAGGGVASLRSTNRYAQQYARMASMEQTANDPIRMAQSSQNMMQAYSSYRPINIVA